MNQGKEIQDTAQRLLPKNKIPQKDGDPLKSIIDNSQNLKTE